MLFLGYSPVLTAAFVRHRSQFLEYHMPPDAFGFGTHNIFPNITCLRMPTGSALTPFSRISPVPGRLWVRHSQHFLEYHMPPDAFGFGTDRIFQIFPCTHGHFNSALAHISGISPVLHRPLLRNSHHFLEYHLYLDAFGFGTHNIFSNITCLRTPLGSALIAFFKYSPVPTATSIRHWPTFPEYHLYSTALCFGTHTIFSNITCTHGTGCQLNFPSANTAQILLIYCSIRITIFPFTLCPSMSARACPISEKE